MWQTTDNRIYKTRKNTGRCGMHMVNGGKGIGAPARWCWDVGIYHVTQGRHGLAVIHKN